MWNFANGTFSLKRIAQQLELPIEKVQQIAFRLIVTNLVEEVFIIPAAPTSVVTENTHSADNLLEPMVGSSKTNVSQSLTPVLVTSNRAAHNLSEPMAGSSKTNVSQSFLQNLVGFLRGKA